MPAMPSRQRVILLIILLLTVTAVLTQQATSLQTAAGAYEDSLIVSPHYVEFLSDTEDRFIRQASELKRRMGSAPHVLVGFAASLPIRIPAVDLSQKLTEKQMAPALESIDRIVERARKGRVAVHITLTSGFFHDINELRPAAILQDVRNAQWYADGWIADPTAMAASAGVTASTVPATAWVTPSRYAKPLRARMEEAIRMV